MPKPPAKPAPPVSPVLILHGPERFLQLEFTANVKATLVALHGEVNTLLFDGANAKAADVLDECRSLSLMQCHKLVIVDNAEIMLKGADDEEGEGAAPPPPPGRRGSPGGKSARDLMIGYVEAPDGGATLLLRAGRWYPSKLDKAVIAASGNEAIKKCAEPGTHEAIKWTLARAAQHQTVIQPDAAAMLVETIGPDLGRLDCELAKLAMVDVGKPITCATVSAMTEMTRQEDFWTIQEALLSGDPVRALHQLQELLEVSRQNEVPIMTSFIDLARKLAGACLGLREKEPIPALMGRLKIWGAGSDALLAAARRLHPDQAAALLRHSVDAAYQHRSGRRDPVMLLEELCLRFTAALGGQPISKH
ncbi:MAG: DNA polymerase III subunit delta [Phycisphaerales bacterium]